MKQTIMTACILFAGCATVPKGLYHNPSAYTGQLILDTSWDEREPVTHFQHVFRVGDKYTDYLGTPYVVVALDEPGWFALRVALDDQ